MNEKERRELELKERKVHALETLAKNSEHKRDKKRGRLTLGSSQFAIARGHEFFDPNE